MRNKAPSRWNKKWEAMEHFDVGSVSNEEIFNELETAQVRQLFNIANAGGIYSESEGLIFQLFMELFLKLQETLK